MCDLCHFKKEIFHLATYQDGYAFERGKSEIDLVKVHRVIIELCVTLITQSIHWHISKRQKILIYRYNTIDIRLIAFNMFLLTTITIIIL